MKKSEIHILIIDDDTSIRTVLSEAMKKFGYKVSAVAKPEEALSLVKIKTFHLALVDMMLPRMNGLELVKEMRLTPFSDTGVIFISGIFRDPVFMQETIKTSKAIEYLVKPLDMKVLKTSVDNAIAPLLARGQVRLQDLLTKDSSTARERAKAVESLEEVSGYALPAILSVLMHEESSGYLNIADMNGDVFGLTLMKGDIVQIDSATSQETFRQILIDKKIMTEEELQQVPADRLKGNAIKNLIEDSWVSPHMGTELKIEQIKRELSKRISSDQLRLNYVEERIGQSEDKITFEHLLPLWYDLSDRVLSQDYLEEFYKELHEFPLKKGPQFMREEKVLQLPMIAAAQSFLNLLDKNMTLDELQQETKISWQTLTRVTHLLALNRWIVFDDARKEHSVIDRFKRIESMYEEVKGKNPFELYAYFGAGLDPKPADVERIFKEFAKSNHPDHLPTLAPEKMRSAVTHLFSILSEAHDVLRDEHKKKKLKDEIKQMTLEKQIKAEALAEEGYQSLQRGRMPAAVDALGKAQQLYPSHRAAVLLAWAKLKSNSCPPVVQKEIAEMMDAIPHEDRRNVEYIFTLGLLKRKQGDIDGAATQFEKAFAMNPQFLEARRELSEIKEDTNKKSFDLLNGDISAIVGNLFRKKSG